MDSVTSVGYMYLSWLKVRLVMVRWSCPSTVSYRYPIYFKTNCDTAAKKLHKIVTGLQGENLELKNDIAILQTRVGKVEEFNQTIDDKFTEVNTNTDNKLVTLKAEIAGEMNVKYATTENTDNQLVLLKECPGLCYWVC